MAEQEEKLSIKDLRIDSSTGNRGRDVAKFMPVIEMIARKELRSKSSQIISFDELVNTGLIAVNKLIEAAKTKAGTEFNSSYIAQSVKWAMKDEVRARQNWYGVKRNESSTAPREADPTETTVIHNLDDARKAVFEVIMSTDSLSDDSGFVAEDPNSTDHLEKLELLSMKESLKKSIQKLPNNLRQVIEMRFYEDLSGNEVAEKLGVTPSRISHMIKEAVAKLKVQMIAEGYN
jgi:RNA polymerase sigma factor (sigma-70 family)